jgi:hypothetical protein
MNPGPGLKIIPGPENSRAQGNNHTCVN